MPNTTTPANPKDRTVNLTGSLEVNAIKTGETRKEIFQAKFPEMCLKEYELVYHTLQESIKDLRSLELYCLVGIGGIWTWLATNTESITTRWVWWIPVALICFGIISTLGTLRSIELRAKYLQNLEKNLPIVARAGGENVRPLGWETYFDENSKKSSEVSFFYTFGNYRTRFFWTGFLILSLLVATAAIVFPDYVKVKVDKSNQPSPTPSPTPTVVPSPAPTLTPTVQPIREREIE